MGKRNFKEELDRITTEFERGSEMLEQVWEALGRRGAELIDVDPRELAAVQEACAWGPGCTAPPSGLHNYVRC